MGGGRRCARPRPGRVVCHDLRGSRMQNVDLDPGPSIRPRNMRDARCIFGRIARRRLRPTATHRPPTGLRPGAGFSTHSESESWPRLQPGCARSRAPFRPPVPCLFRPDNHLFGACSGPVKFPVPRPLRPATGGLPSQQCDEIAGLSGSERRQRPKRLPASRQTGLSAADRERDDFGPHWRGAARIAVIPARDQEPRAEADPASRRPTRRERHRGRAT